MSYFTYAAAQQMLSSLNTRFGLFPLADWRGQPGIILRHDIDLDVQPAHRLSMAESDIGVRGTFFFMTTAQTYNCGSSANRRLIREMANAGHEIALHFDPSIYNEVDPATLGNLARLEAALLEDICGMRIGSVSLHNPSVANNYPMLPGWLNAYDDQIFTPEIYLSDSRMNFRSDPMDFFDEAGDRTHQLLLHPMHYSDEPPLYPRAQLDYLRRMAGELDAIFSPNSTYHERVGDQWYDMLRQDAAAWKKSS
ncbi:hypothetical protein GRI44_10390 [Altererythrobacter confluentis]|uniref:Chitooligosaccharide deacetylase n=1 Tax=Allopontixanthobacter confluentis TaxID=1849021 RepID=A0A6L7GI21_9SPHN|nr:hypothetical protein [Allopontixanthobacter confluentis]MXP15156.1 hypothetical protein [Allopontixanthobacter confluentis]